MKRDFLNGMKTALPICLGVIPIGISFGLISVQSGLTGFQTTLMSAIVLAGSSQIMAVGMVAQGAALVSIVLATLFVNLRHIVMSSAVMSRLRGTSLPKRLIGAYAICDESFALFTMSGSQSFSFLIGIETALVSSWIASTVIGCIVNSFLPEIVVNSFGIAIYAAFLGMLLPSVKNSTRLILLVVMTGLLNWLLRLVLEPSWALILAMVLGAAAGVFFVEDEPKVQNCEEGAADEH
ncbi:MAG: AzlC family ABC transporter permease [Eubacteriales bacterium]|nr:AzlC family ABC transporter permease [Eubacteriales bacterium]